jgi:hypothetical protein
MLIRSELLDLNKHYRIFHMNQVLTNRSILFKDSKTNYYCELEILKDHLAVKRDAPKKGEKTAAQISADRLEAEEDKKKSAWEWIRLRILEVDDLHAIVRRHYGKTDDSETVVPKTRTATNNEELKSEPAKLVDGANIPKAKSKPTSLAGGLEPNEDNCQVIGKYILEYFLPVLYKYIRGLLTLNTENVKDSYDYILTSIQLNSMIYIKNKLWVKIQYILDKTQVVRREAAERKGGLGGLAKVQPVMGGFISGLAGLAGQGSGSAVAMKSSNMKMGSMSKASPGQNISQRLSQMQSGNHWDLKSGKDGGSFGKAGSKKGLKKEASQSSFKGKTEKSDNDEIKEEKIKNDDGDGWPKNQSEGNKNGAYADADPDPDAQPVLEEKEALGQSKSEKEIKDFFSEKIDPPKVALQKSQIIEKTDPPPVVQTPPPITEKTDPPPVVQTPPPKNELSLPTSQALVLDSIPDEEELVPVDLKNLKIDSKFAKSKTQRRPRPEKILTDTRDPKKHPNPPKPTQDREDTKQIKGNKRKQIEDSLEARRFYIQLMSQITEIFLEFDAEASVQLYGSYWGDEENIYRYNHPTKLNSGFSLSTSGWASSIKHLGMFEIDSTLDFNAKFNTPLG